MKIFTHTKGEIPSDLPEIIQELRAGNYIHSEDDSVAIYNEPSEPYDIVIRNNDDVHRYTWDRLVEAVKKFKMIIVTKG